MQLRVRKKRPTSIFVVVAILSVCDKIHSMQNHRTTILNGMPSIVRCIRAMNRNFKSDIRFVAWLHCFHIICIECIIYTVYR